MKLRDFKALKELGVDELRAKERELTDEMFHLRLRRSTQQLTNPMKLRSTRRTLARVKTLLGQGAQGGSAR